MLRRCQMTLRRSGLVLGGFLAHFEPIIEGFKAQILEIQGGDFFHTLGTKEEVGSYF